MILFWEICTLRSEFLRREYKTLVLSGGFMKGISILAIISELDINSITTFIGCSVGAVISFLLLIGFSAEDIFKITMKVLISNFRNEFIRSIMLLGLQPSLMSKVIILDVIVNLMEQKGIRKDITFFELLEETGKRLVITVWNANISETEYFSPKT